VWQFTFNDKNPPDKKAEAAQLSNEFKKLFLS